MSGRRAPWLALALLRCVATAPFTESLEGDLLEEFAAGRSSLWFWRQVFCALGERALSLMRQQAAILLAVTAFFVLALWAIAPATYPVMGWARAAEPLRPLVLLGWLMGVPFLLGGIAGAAQKIRRFGAILLGAGLAYLTPVTEPFEFMVCDLCSAPDSNSTPTAALFMTPLGSALLAGLGAWVFGRFRHSAAQEHPG
jgi:hypothetical protein